MTTIPPQFALLVNDLPEAVHGPLLEFLGQLVPLFNISAKTPSSFAAAESEVVAAIVQLGMEVDLALATQFAADSPLLTMSYDDETKSYRRLEPSRCDVVTPFGRGSIERSLYRETGTHNGPTVDPVALRCGLLASATPAAAKLVGAFVGAVPSREAETLVKQFGVDTLSRSTIERTAQALGERLEDHRDELDTTLIDEFEIPASAVTLGASVDRVAVPIEKPRARRPGRRRKGAARKPIEVVYEMAYVLCWTLYDAERNPLYTARAGRMPDDGAGHEVEERLRWDLLQLLERRPDLHVVALSDGAPEMINILRRVTEGIDVAFQLVDVWHAVEYVAEACRALALEVALEVKRAKKDLLSREDGAAKVLGRMRWWRTQRRKQGKRIPKALSDAIRYFENKTAAGLMDYGKALNAGFPVGSGTVEATAKTVVSIRMKRSGSRWKHRSGQHVLTLRSHLVSSRWDDVMAWHVAANDNQTPAIREVA